MNIYERSQSSTYTHTLLKNQSIGAGDDSAGGGDRKDHGWIAAWLE